MKLADIDLVIFEVGGWVPEDLFYHPVYFVYVCYFPQ